jgi:hypothetical protein
VGRGSAGIEDDGDGDGVGVEVGLGVADEVTWIGLDEGFGSKQLRPYHPISPFSSSRNTTSSIVYGSDIGPAASSQY